jgi:hypothetical protein
MKSEYANHEFIYTMKTIDVAIRKACGPLVVFRGDSVHLLHFSLKEFLAKPPTDQSSLQKLTQLSH